MMKKLTFNRPPNAKPQHPKPISTLFGNQQPPPTNKPQIITSLSDRPPSPPRPPPLIIPCPELLPPTKPIPISQTAKILYDPASEPKQAWEARQKILSDQDLGPPPQAFKARQAATSPELNSTLLARAHNVPIGESNPSQYSRVSVEDFGLAMLMGMGFDPKTSPFVPAHQPYRRAFARAGLGAEKGADSPRTKKKKQQQETHLAWEPEAIPQTNRHNPQNNIDGGKGGAEPVEESAAEAAGESGLKAVKAESELGSAATTTNDQKKCLTEQPSTALPVPFTEKLMRPDKLTDNGRSDANFRAAPPLMATAEVDGGEKDDGDRKRNPNYDNVIH